MCKSYLLNYVEVIFFPFSFSIHKFNGFILLLITYNVLWKQSNFVDCFFNVIAASTFQQDESELSNIFGGNSQLLTLGLGLLATALAATYVTRLAKVSSFDFL